MPWAAVALVCLVGQLISLAAVSRYKSALAEIDAELQRRQTKGEEKKEKREEREERETDHQPLLFNCAIYSGKCCKVQMSSKCTEVLTMCVCVCVGKRGEENDQRFFSTVVVSLDLPFS